MNWFDTSGLTSLAKTALKEAQKTIDKALDIQDELGDSSSPDPPTPKAVEDQTPTVPDYKNADFLSSWGLTMSGGDLEETAVVKQPIITESPSKSEAQGIWSSFTGSLFDQKATEKSELESTRNNLHHLTGETTLLETAHMVSDGENLDSNKSQSELDFNLKTIDLSPVLPSVSNKEEVPLHNAYKDDKQYPNSRLNRLSIVSCDSGKDSSDSVELLGSQSLKTTPDSEAVSLIQSISNSSKLNSDSLEVLPDSLVSPSSIECLGFDENISDGINLSPFQEDDPSFIGNRDCFAEGQTKDKSSDSVSLVVDDDEDTISYNSVSECTVPTVLDINEENPTPTHSESYIQKIQKHLGDGTSLEVATRASLDSKYTEITLVRDSVSCSQTPSSVIKIIPVTKSYPSSNDGSWSDRTLNADSESAINDINLEDSILKTNTEHTRDVVTLGTYDETCTDKMSDSSSFCNVTESGDILSSITSINQSFITIDKITSSDRADTSLEDEHREQHSPISSESRSDVVKVGSDQTSGHTSGDEIETTTSSDIEIIPSPNGDHSQSYCRQSPAKCSQRKSGSDLMTSNLVELVLGKSLASKVKGHSRELSEASLQSNTSEESHCSESEKLMRRLCEMADVLEARESRLIEVSRHNVELNEANAELKMQLENALAKIEIGEISMITEDYTQRLSALEKKFQQAIKEKDMLRKQIDLMKQEAAVNASTSSGEAIKEKEDTIKELREEGEKLSKQHFSQSTIIKKLRVKDKETEQLVKKLKDRMAEQTQEIERLKRSLGAKEELECSQIEAVYKLTNSNKKLETELLETKSALDDALNRLQTSKTSLDAARKELTELQRNQADVRRKRDTLGQLERDKSQLDTENEQLRRQLDDLRAKMVQEETAWARREERLRCELSDARAREAEAECREVGVAGAGGAGLLSQLAQLQHSALARERQHQAQIAALTHHHSEAESKLSALIDTERELRKECSTLQVRAGQLESALSAANARLEDTSTRCQEYLTQLTQAEETVNRLTKELAASKASSQASMAQLSDKLALCSSQLAAERISAEAEKRRNTILQEQVRELSSQCQSRGSPLAALLCEDSSPPHSIASESLGSSQWQQDDTEFSRLGGSVGTGIGGVSSSALVESLQAALWRREGEVRAAAAGARRAAAERAGLAVEVARLTAELQNLQAVQNQYDALLQMYGEKEEQLQELNLDLQDVKDLYKMQLDEIILLRRQLAEHVNG